MASLEDRVENFPSAWKPKTGEKLTGTITELSERESEFGAYPAVGISTDTGEEVVFHAFHVAARNQLARLRPEVGDRLAVKYFGKDEEKGYEKYRILIDRTAPAINWDTHAVESAAELAAGGADVEPGETESDALALP